MLKFISSYALLLLLSVGVKAQKINLTINGLVNKPIRISCSSTLKAQENINTKWTQLIEQGYLLSSVDSVVKVDSTNLMAYFFKGNKFNYAKVTTNIPAEIKSKMGLKESYFKNKVISPEKLTNITSSILDYCSNNGHPFAQIDFKKTSIEAQKLNLQLNLNLGPRIIIDKIVVPKELESQQNLIKEIIGIKEKDEFNQQNINSISSRIKETTYYTELKAAEYEIINNKLQLFVFIKNKSAKFINGVIGIQPQDNEKISLTGDARIKLENAFKKGETFELNWKRMYVQSQSLNSSIRLPYLFKSSFGIFNQFDLMKKDSSFFNLTNRFGSSFSFSNRNSISFFYQFDNSNSLQQSINSQKSTTLNSIGISFEINNLDYKFNPRKGLVSKADVKLGNKTIFLSQDTTNSTTSSFDYQLFFELHNYFRISNNSTLKVGGQMHAIFNPFIYENELLRIGGNNNLRGFDEQSILVSSYAIGTIEYRILLEQNSNIFTFFNYAWTETNTSELYSRDNPYSFGLGINFETRPGIFSVSYALGSQQNNPILFKTAKIHFGFINFF